MCSDEIQDAAPGEAAQLTQLRARSHAVAFVQRICTVCGTTTRLHDSYKPNSSLRQQRGLPEFIVGRNDALHNAALRNALMYTAAVAMCCHAQCCLATCLTHTKLPCRQILPCIMLSCTTVPCRTLPLALTGSANMYNLLFAAQQRLRSRAMGN